MMSEQEMRRTVSCRDCSHRMAAGSRRTTNSEILSVSDVADRFRQTVKPSA